jgi:hypothetical protein
VEERHGAIEVRLHRRAAGVREVDLAQLLVARVLLGGQGNAGWGEREGDHGKLAGVDGPGRVERDPEQHTGTPIAPRGRPGQDPQPGWRIDGQVLRQSETARHDLGAVADGQRELVPAAERGPAPVLRDGPAGRGQEQQQDRPARQLMNRS